MTVSPNQIIIIIIIIIKLDIFRKFEAQILVGQAFSEEAR